MGRGRGEGQDYGGPGIRRNPDSLDPGGVYAKAIRRLPDPEFEGVSVDTYSHGGQVAELRSSPLPYDLETGRIFDDHDVFNDAGAWIGADRPVPHRRMTNGALAGLGPEMVKSLFDRYAAGDYGHPEDGGEVGFALYRVGGGETAYLIDDATRSLEGEPPLRDPETSPGPQTVLLSHEY